MRLPALVLLAALSAGAQPPNTLSPEEKKEGWVLLFDGRSFAGWQDPGKTSPPSDAWALEEGAIKATRRPRVRQDLFTQEDFGDFELAFEWRISPRGNSGLKYRIQDRFWVEERSSDAKLKRFEDLANYRMTNRLNKPPAEGQQYVVGFEYQMIDNASFSGDRGMLQRAGSLYDMASAEKDAAQPAGEWNQARVTVRGDRAEHWLNGIKVVDTSLRSPEVKANIERRWGTGSPIARALAEARPRGPISLQNHNDEAWFRSIKLRRLK